MKRRFRLSTLFAFATLLTIVVALGSWGLALRGEVGRLEERVSLLELEQRLITLNEPVSPVGVPLGVDHGMQIDTMQFAR